MGKNIKHIEFDYVDNWTCNLKDKEYSHWGCCCQCTQHLRVTNHCSTYPKINRTGCVCDDNLGFWVCTVFANTNETDRANLSGEHGVCEMFRKRVKEK